MTLGDFDICGLGIRLVDVSLVSLEPVKRVKRGPWKLKEQQGLTARLDFLHRFSGLVNCPLGLLVNNTFSLSDLHQGPLTIRS